MASDLLRCADISLPTELVLLVLGHLEEEIETLSSLARTCRAMQYLAEERLYKDIQVLTVNHLHAIIDAFRKRKERVRAVQTLDIAYQYRVQDLQNSDGDRAMFNDCVAHMVKLRQWYIESPYDDFNWEGPGGQAWVNHDMQQFRRALAAAAIDGPKEAERISAEQKLGRTIERSVGLALLEELTIHSHGATADFWDLDGFHCLFRHPCLRYLHVSCIAFADAEIPELASHIRKSPLQTLIFDECELQPKSLLSILRTPTNLKTLTLGENVFNSTRLNPFDPVLSKNFNATLDALATVAHSLESLTHLDPGWRADLNPQLLRSVRPAGEGMRLFHSLAYLECDTNSFLHQTVIMNRDLAPPNLETLCVRRHWNHGIDFWDRPPAFDPYMTLPSLDHLELMQAGYVGHELSRSDYICDEERLRNYHAKAYKLSKAGINLRMLIELHLKPSLIPPYLHGECSPEVVCLYDASDIGFVRPDPAIEERAFEDYLASVVANHKPELSEAERLDNEVAAEAAWVYSFHLPRPDEPTIESDQLSSGDVRQFHLEVDNTIREIVFKLFDDESDQDDHVDIDDLDEDEDMELDMEIDDDDGFVDEDGVHFFEHDGELYLEVYDDDDEFSDVNTDEQMDGADMEHQLAIDELD